MSKTPKFVIAFSADACEIKHLIEMYGKRLAHWPSDPSYAQWNVERLKYLLTLLEGSEYCLPDDDQ